MNEQNNMPTGIDPNAPQNPGYNPAPSAPAVRLRTDRSLLKYILLSIVTLGIYGLVTMTLVADDINTAASRYDGKKTMHFCLLFFLVGWLTLGIGYLVWYHKLSERIGNELRRRNIAYNFSATDFWLWEILGVIIVIGPFIYMHKLFTATNLICENYNVNG